MNRVRILAVSLSLAAGLFATTASSALMAIVERPFCAADQGLITASYSYDDSQTPPLVTIITVTNLSDSAQPITAVVINPLTDNVVFQRTVNARVGTRTFDVSNLAGGVHMIDRVDRFGTHYWGLPYTVGCQVG